MRPPKSRGESSVQSGFTIAELLIATAIFSVILTGALFGFIQIGRMFYKGVSVTQTQETTRQIVNTVKDNIQLAASVSSAQSGNGYSYYCVGNNRYTYSLGRKVELAASPNHNADGNFGLLYDKLPGSTACATPCASNCPDASVAFREPIELLGNKMRLGRFDVVQADPSKTPDLYKIDVYIIYGDDEILSYTDEDNPASAFCSGSLSIQQFCAVSKLSTTVYRGLHP
jgi:prepilin-type N-terminal cleavage/methylation domain-containing protein